MAGFCRNCGSPLADGQGFCSKCGTSASGPPVRPAAQPPAPPAAAAAAAPPAPRPAAPPPPRPAYAQATAAAAPAKSGMSTLVKVLIAFFVVIFLLGAAGVAGMWYLAHRVKEKVHDMGLDQISDNTNHGPVLGGADPCGLLSKSDVGQVLKMDVVRAERVSSQNEGCQYSVIGNDQDMTATHLAILQQSIVKEQKEPMTDAQKQQMEQTTRSFFKGMDTQQGSPAKHPGEAVAFQFGVSKTGAKAAMSMTRLAFGRLGPAFTELPGIGDEAFDVGGALILARKGDTVVQVVYTMCPCGRDDAATLARKIVANL